MTPILIIGAGGFGRECHDIVLAMNRHGSSWDFLGFVDDVRPDTDLLDRRGTHWLGAVDVLSQHQGASYVVGVADAGSRRRLSALADEAGLSAAVLTHPSATVGMDVTVAEGTVICSHVSITTNVRIGRHVQLDQNVAVGHDAALGSFSRVNPGATISGSVILDEDAYIGTNSTVLQGLKVGRAATVGAGAAVVRNVPDGQTVVGVPATTSPIKAGARSRRSVGASAEMAILLTSVGRRNYLAEYFKEALAPRLGRTIGVDASPAAPGLRSVDVGLVVPAITEPEYVDRLINVVREHGVSAVFPLNDLDILVLAHHSQRFRAAGCRLMTPTPDRALDCADKLRTQKLITEAGLNAPRTWSSPEEVLDATDVTYPLVIKPRFGSASLGVETVETPGDIETVWNRVTSLVSLSAFVPPGFAADSSAVVAQERLSGIEYGLDVVNDLDGNFRAAALKRKIRMRSGETDQATSELLDGQMLSVARVLSASIAHPGVMDVDLFIEGDRISILELNPRFGGGYPFSHAAGMNAVTPLVRWLAGEETYPIAASSPGITSAKCDRIVTHRGAIDQLVQGGS